MNWEQANQDLEARRQKAALGGGEARIQKQHDGGKLTARERLELLFDKGTFVETDAFVESRIDDFDLDKRRVPGDGVVTGYGYVEGRLVYAASEDFTVIGGTLGESHSMKIRRIQDMALEMKAPFVCINDSGGARIEEGIDSLSGYAGMFLRHTKASGVIPQIAVILGPCSGGACYAPAICDFIFMVKDTSKMFITGPNVVKTVINEETTVEELGGAMVHATKSGVSHFTYDSEQECLMGVRKLLNYLPSSYDQKAPVIIKEEKKALSRSFNRVLGNLGRKLHGKKEKEVREMASREGLAREGSGRKKLNPCALLTEIVPDNSRHAYDVKKVIDCVVDWDSFFEVQEQFAKNVVVGFGRLNGRSVGIVANQPAYLAGVLDIDASDKAARFIRFCDCFNIPLITFEDVPGFLPGTVQEHNGIIRHGAKIVYAYAEATVPKITLITRKAYGGAYIVMSSKPTGSDVNLAYPQAEIAVMGAEGAVNILYRKSSPEEKEEIIKEYEEKFSNPYRAAERGFIDEIIMPRNTRYKLVQALEMAHNKNQSNPPKKHGNMPL